MSYLGSSLIGGQIQDVVFCSTLLHGSECERARCVFWSIDVTTVFFLWMSQTIMFNPWTRDVCCKRFKLSALFRKQLAVFWMHHPLLWNTWNDAVSCTRRLESWPQPLWEPQVLLVCCTSYAHSLLELWMNVKMRPCTGGLPSDNHEISFAILNTATLFTKFWCTCTFEF